jgi:transcriptional regulator with XRE-family HTH domain
MSQLLEEYRVGFQDENVRYAVAEDFLSTYIAAQIKELRGDRSQQEIADAIGTKQSGISRLENVNYCSWEVETLRKLARAYGVRLRISFEEFGTLLTEMQNFNRESIKRRPFAKDPVFFARQEVPAIAVSSRPPSGSLLGSSSQSDETEDGPEIGRAPAGANQRIVRIFLIWRGQGEAFQRLRRQGGVVSRYR